MNAARLAAGAGSMSSGSDILAAHAQESLLDVGGPLRKALRIAARIEIHCTPKHGSWLKMAEVETNVLRSQCLDRRILNRETLCRVFAAWQRDRNGSAKPVDWRSRTEDARIKLKSLDPSVQ